MDNLPLICRSCQSNNLISIFSLGQLPLANRLLKKAQLNDEEPKYHLEIILCKQCSLVQLKNIVSPEHLFDDYLYFSSNSVTMVKSAENLVEKIVPTLPNNAQIIEIASNDGYLLQHYINKEISVLGIEPAKNIAKYAIERGITTRCDYFSVNLVEKLLIEGYQADIIHANNVMAHISDLNDFASGIKKLLKPNGQAIIEVPYLLNLINHCEFDTIYHEHIFYFSLQPLDKLFNRHQLIISNVEEIPIHGGSLRLYVKHDTHGAKSQAVHDMLNKELELQLDKHESYLEFTKKIFKLKEELITLLKSIKEQGKKIAAYGASAKGSTLLNFFGIGKDLIEFVVDRSPVKQGYYMSGNKIPIYSPDTLIKEKIPYTLLLTWNFAKEIMSQQQEYLNQGGQFIIPIPKLQVVK